MDKNFWITQLIGFLIHFSIAYGNGLLVRHKNIKVNYTRKINHFFLFFLPIFLNSIFVYERTLVSTIIGLCIMTCSLIIYIEPVRTRITPIGTAFLSFDRPEDRPFTLLWLSTQIAMAGVVLVPLLIYFSSINMVELIYIPLFINGLGDGLAEPVGIRFGKHSYETWALFTRKKFIRTYEGSACVLVVSILTIILFQNSFTTPQFVVALISIPIVMTLAEAFSPHTWDTPFLYTASGLSLSGIMML